MSTPRLPAVLRENALVQGTWRWRQPWKLCVRVSREEYSGETRLTPGQIAPYFARGDTNVFIGPTRTASSSACLQRKSRLVQEKTLASTRAPGNDVPIGGLKVVSTSGRFAARPSGTENIYKLYAESLKSDEHLASIVKQAKEIVSRSLATK